MKKRNTRVLGALGALALAGTALLTVAPSSASAAPAAPAQAAPRTEASGTIQAPVLFGAMINAGDVWLGWPPETIPEGAVYYRAFADGRFIVRFPVHAGMSTYIIHLADYGLNAKETYTLVAEDAAGNLSAPSEGRVPRGFT